MADLEASFDELQANVNANPELVSEARERRNVFRDALRPEPDVSEVVFSGSIARGSQIEPIRDVDLVAIYRREEHPNWGAPGESAEEALEHAREQVVRLLGAGGTDRADFVRLARPGNHALKCFLDDPDDEDAFTVDVVPALREDDGTLLITEADNDRWIRSHPELMNERVAERHEDWRSFVPLTRDLKRWNRDNGETMVALLLEVLALDCLPRESRSNALARFFAAAARRIDHPIYDPAGISEIQSDLDHEAARERLEAAADTSWRAVAAEDQGEIDAAACYWRELFGDIFPEPPGGCDDRRAGRASAAAIGGAMPAQHRRPVRDTPQG